jgi:hypothetical protein
MTAMKCFVAMAFKHDDTDRLYEEAICAVLGERGIGAIRVDRVEHNDNIDDRLLLEIREADFMIADLTYARPSVYYEAGFAERTIPVIYTVRRDHFSADPADRFGNLQVHFDLSMRNIIDWIDAHDATFLQRLKQRVELVTRPLLAASAADQDRKREAAEFQLLAVDERKKLIATTASRLLGELGYYGHRALKRAGLSPSSPFGSDEWYLPSRSPYRFVRLALTDDYEYLGTDSSRPGYNLNVGYLVAELEQIEEHWLFASLAKADLHEVSRSLPTFKRIADAQTFTEDLPLSLPILERGFRGDVFIDFEIMGEIPLLGGGHAQDGFRTKSPPINSTYKRAGIRKEFQFVYGGYSTRKVVRRRFVHIIDNVTATTDFAERLRAVLEKK